MAMDFEAMQAAATAATAKNHFDHEEGETLLLLIPFSQGWENGKTTVPWVAHQILGGDDAFPYFKRPIMSTNQPYCETPEYLAAALAAGKATEIETGEVDEHGNPIKSIVLTVQDAGEALVDSGELTEGQVNGGIQDVCSWAVCKIADRRRDTDAWSYSFEKTQVARFKRGNDAKPGQQRNIERLLSRGYGPAIMGELDNYLTRVANGEKPEGPVKAKLVVLPRKGKGLMGTTYPAARLANETDGVYGDYTIPQMILDDIAAAIRPGGYANIHVYNAESATPSQSELDYKVYKRKGDGGGESRPSMTEE